MYAFSAINKIFAQQQMQILRILYLQSIIFSIKFKQQKFDKSRMAESLLHSPGGMTNSQYYRLRGTSTHSVLWSNATKP